jgi:D-amino peptidase
MEGVSGVFDFEQINAGASEYQRARTWFTHDVNAAVQGCLAAGAEHILITDNHNFQLNYLYDDLPPEAEVVMGGHIAHRPLLVMEGLDESYDLALLVGYHAAAHYPGGVLSHSYFLPANFWEVRINGMPVGEPEIGAALAGSAGVPCGLMVADDVTCQETLKFLPGIETVVTKYALDRTAARLIAMAKTGPAIRAGAQRACERARQGDLKPWTFDLPVTLEVTVANFGLANRLGDVPGATRLAHRVVGYETPSFNEMYKMLLTWCYITMSSGEPTEALEG